MARPVARLGERWPREMRAETAAAYCDEPSVEAFRSKVDKGIYCQPALHPGCQPKWHRGKLDRDIARRHGLQADAAGVVDDASELI
jgi:hypothetical protein